MEFLIKTYSNNKVELITAASPEETKNKLLQYLEEEKVTLVEEIPESTGIFCEEEDGIYYVNESHYNKGYERQVLYSLQWASWTEKQAATLTEDLPSEPPELTRELTI